MSFVTNATTADGIRLEKFLPHVLQVFGPYLDELLVIVDHQPEEGRIQMLHNTPKIPFVPLDDVISTYTSTIVRFEPLDFNTQDSIGKKWFAKTGINRCQNGTPIFAFLYGIEKARNPYIIRTDCDILFCDKGFVNEIEEQSGKFDLMQLPSLNDSYTPFSTRGFVIDRDLVHQILPLKPHRLDFLRRIHRSYMGRTGYLALEQILEREIENGRMSLSSMPTLLGYTMHIPTRKDFIGIEPIIRQFQDGRIPADQLLFKHDYIPSLWKENQK